ncbi:ABC transporter permease [Lactococcus carnosus]|uniref:ABC transporter permease subunit n=1 Tax=Pseudolactococcus carnosus TaxID=2749961 RepID=A0ABT0AT14_9LACT|nr:ABC transporter permease subunit [Lactococcus carnosus]MCJ1989863.1 ABC transporter permease subunit [Lactococcus carnosus]
MYMLYKFELKKIVKTKLFSGVCLALLVTTLGAMWTVFYISPMGIGPKEMSKRSVVQYNQKFARQYEGDLTDSKIKEVLSDYLAFYKSRKQDENKYQEEIPNNVFSYRIADAVLNPKDNLPNQVDKNPNVSIDDIPVKPISSLGINKDIKPIKLTSYYGWSDLYKMTEVIYIPIVMAIIVACSGIFSSERAANIDQLLLATKHGRKRLTTSKICAVGLVSVTLFLVTSLLILGSFFIFYGFDGWNGSIQANFELATFTFPIALSHLQVYLVMLGIQLFNVLFISSLGILISSFTNSPFISMIISLVIFVIPKGLDKLFTVGTLPNKVQQYLPINNFSVDTILQKMTNNEEVLRNSFTANLLIIGVTACLVMVVSLVVTSTHQKKYYAS